MGKFIVKLFAIGLSLICSLCYGAVVDGVSAGFVTVAPTADPTGSDQVADDVIETSKFTSPAGATTVTELGWYCGYNDNEGNDYELGIYTHDAGNDEADDLVEKTSATPVIGGAGWNRRTGLSISISPSTDYWFAVQIDASTLATNLDYTATGGQHDFKAAPQTTLPDPNFGAPSGGGGTRIFAIYAVYTTGEDTALFFGANR